MNYLVKTVAEKLGTDSSSYYLGKAITRKVSAPTKREALAAIITTSDQRITRPSFKVAFDDSLISPLKRKILNSARSLRVELPSEWSLDLSEIVIDKLKFFGVTPKFINPLGEGGVLIEFFNDEDSYVIEIYNDKNIVYLIDSSNGMIAYDLNKEELIQKMDKLSIRLIGINV